MFRAIRLPRQECLLALTAFSMLLTLGCGGTSTPTGPSLWSPAASIGVTGHATIIPGTVSGSGAITASGGNCTATGTITIRNPNGRNGFFRVITIDCSTLDYYVGKDIPYVDPQGNSGVVQGGNAIGIIVDAGASGVVIVINLSPTT